MLASEDCCGTFVWYIKMVERSFRKILFWLGDENATTKAKIRNTRVDKGILV